MESLKKSVIIEYLIKEIDLCEPLDEVYNTYFNTLFKYDKLDVTQEYTNIAKYLSECRENFSCKEKFILKITSMDKKKIIDFCINEYFLIEIKKIEEILNRKLIHTDFD